MGGLVSEEGGDVLVGIGEIPADDSTIEAREDFRSGFAGKEKSHGGPDDFFRGNPAMGPKIVFRPGKGNIK